MSFFNNKEEVIDMQLTQYGKKNLADGVFSPKYYAFFDEDIIYDSNCFAIQEKQNNAQTRILEETPYLKIQTNFSSSAFVKLFGEKENNLIGVPLTSIDDSELYAPAINIIFSNSEMESVNFESDKWYNKFGTYIVPQINLKKKVFEIVVDSEYSKKTLTQNEIVTLPIKQDDSFIKTVIEELTFDIFEENVEELMKNFDIEIYQTQGEKITKLYFDNEVTPEPGIVVDDILYPSAIGLQPTDSTLPDAENPDGLLTVVNPLSVSSYFNYTSDIIIDQGNLSDRRLFIYDPELYIAPPCP